LNVLIMLGMLMSCSFSQMSYAENKENALELELTTDVESEIETAKRTYPVINLDLELPKEKIVEFNGEPGVFFTLSQFQTILAIYSSYISIADENMMLNEDLYYLNLEYESCLAELETSDKMINTIANDSKKLISIVHDQSQREEKNDNRRFFVRTLIGAGGVVVGLAVGLLVGMATP